METKLLRQLIDRQLNKSQIEVLEELLEAIKKIDSTDINEAFMAEASNHKVFDACYEEDTSHLIERLNKEFPSLDGYIEQLSCEDYCTDHDTYDSIEEEQEAKDNLIYKINEWKDDVDSFIDLLCNYWEE